MAPAAPHPTFSRFANSSIVPHTLSSSIFRHRNARANALTIAAVDARPRHPGRLIGHIRFVRES